MGVDQNGQSVLEFVFLLPVIVGLTVLTVRISTVIQMSIVNQKYARAQTLFLTYNSPVYPRLFLQEGMITKKSNQMILGVSGNVIPEGRDGGQPDAAIYEIVRKSGRAGGTPGGSDEPQLEPKSRSKIRVRNTITLCAPTLVRANGTPFAETDGEKAGFRIKSPHAIAEQERFSYCSTQLEYKE